MPRRPGVFDIPAIERKWAYWVLVLDVLPGGVGTIMAGVHAKHRPSVVIGILQLLLVPLAIGWVWSVAWGIGFYLRSR